MRATFARLLIPSLALALAGCGGSNNPYPRVEFPKSAGNYIQFYRDGGVTVAELAKVDSGGTVQSITSARWHGKVHLDVGVNNQTALFDGCGVLITFKERANDKIGTSGFYPISTDGLKRAENFRSCRATLRRIRGLWNRSM